VERSLSQAPGTVISTLLPLTAQVQPSFFPRHQTPFCESWLGKHLLTRTGHRVACTTSPHPHTNTSTQQPLQNPSYIPSRAGALRGVCPPVSLPPGWRLPPMAPGRCLPHPFETTQPAPCSMVGIVHHLLEARAGLSGQATCQAASLSRALPRAQVPSDTALR
jgi:hypothetical protein